MAGPYKATMLYGTPDAGWSETHYIPGASLGTAQNTAQTINTSRLAISRPSVLCVGIRVVDVTTPRLGSIISPTTAGGTYAIASISTADPNLAVLMRLVSADGLTRSRHYIRGIPADCIPGNTSNWDPLVWSFTTGVSNALNAYASTLIANANLGIRTAPHTYTLKAIQTATPITTATFRKAGRPFFLRHGRRLLV